MAKGVRVNAKSLIIAGCAVTGMVTMLCACGASAHSAQAGGTASSSPASGGPASGGTASAGSTVSGSPAPSASAAAVPAGYHVVGGSAQGISLAAPSSWVTINFAQETLKQAAQRLNLPGVSASQLVQDMQTLEKDHAVIVYDVKSAVDSAAHFATNLNAYCLSSGLNESGSSAVPILRQDVPAEFQKIGATDIDMRDVNVGGVPGVETSYTLDSGAGTLYAGQLEVLPSADRACFVTLTGSSGYFPDGVLTVAAATAQFYG
jgi:hypothetical protein